MVTSDPIYPYPTYPHCNAEVLHAPGECVYCDEFPERQAARTAGKTPFTPVGSNGWRGNIAWTPQMVLDEAAYWEEIREHYRTDSREVRKLLNGTWETTDSDPERLNRNRIVLRISDAWKRWRNNHGN